MIKFEIVKRILGQMEDSDDKNTRGFTKPIKGSKKAAGYDFINPEEITIEPKQIKIVPTGIKAYFPDDVGLLLLNRSSNPKKKNLVLMNGVGLIDADYVDNADNEGEIGFMFMNIGDTPITLKEGDKLGQGVFVKYLDVDNYDDKDIASREGGWGSTDNK